MKIFSRFQDYLLIAIGAVIQAVAMDMFLAPGKMSSGGVSGISQIINQYTGWPIGVMIVLANIPLFFLGWRFLGGRRFFWRTIFAVIIYASSIDILASFLPQNVTADPFLNALFGGVLNGLGIGLVFRCQGTSGGTDILARLLGVWRGIPLSQSYLITDGLVVFASGIAFSWTLALYAIVSLYIAGVATELASEGSGIVRTATIITNIPDAVAQKIMSDLQRGVTKWNGTGMYSGAERPILFCAVSRGEVNQLKAIIEETDPNAFVVIGQAHEALGEGFKPLKK